MFALLGLVAGCLVGALFTFLTFHGVAFFAGPRAAHNAAFISGPIWVLIFGGIGLSVGHAKNPSERLVQELILRQRLVDALHWWVALGQRLTGDPNFLNDHVRLNGPKLLGKKEEVIALYHDQNDPCTTVAGTKAFAEWAVKNQAELIADHLPRSSDHSVKGLMFILRAHRQRDIIVLREVESALLSYQAQAAPVLREEPIQSRWKRTITDYTSLLAFRVQARNEIEAGNYSEEEKAELRVFVDELVRDEMRNRIGARTEEGAPTH
jgi:hypothetical protein